MPLPLLLETPSISLMRHKAYNLVKLIAIAATASAVAAIFPSINYINAEDVWDDWAPSECHDAVSRLQHFSIAHGKVEKCYKDRSKKQYQATVIFKEHGATLPIVLSWNDVDNVNFNRAIVLIMGGPGTIISERKPHPVEMEIAKRCKAVLVTPVYYGSYERSAYPNPSSRVAESEVAGVISYLEAKGIAINILAYSLGGHILSSKDTPVPKGDHLLISPMLNTPMEVQRYFKSNILSRNTYAKRVIVVEGRVEQKDVNLADFQSAYFDSGGGDGPLNFIERWSLKDKVNSEARMHVVIADQEERAGGLEFRGDLERLGFSVSVVNGKHEPRNYDEELQRFSVIRSFGRMICP